MGISSKDFWDAVEKFFETVYNPNWNEADFMKNLRKTEPLKLVIPGWYAEIQSGEEFVWRGRTCWKESDALFFYLDNGMKFYQQSTRLPREEKQK